MADKKKQKVESGQKWRRNKDNGVIRINGGSCLLQLRCDRTCIGAFVRRVVRVCGSVKGEEDVDIVACVEDVVDGLFSKMTNLTRMLSKKSVR